MAATQQTVEQHAIATRNLVASFLHDWARAHPEVMARIDAALSAGASWKIETRLSPNGLPSVAIDLVTANGTHAHLADLAFDAPAAVN